MSFHSKVLLPHNLQSSKLNQQNSKLNHRYP